MGLWNFPLTFEVADAIAILYFVTLVMNNDIIFKFFFTIKNEIQIFLYKYQERVFIIITNLIIVE